MFATACCFNADACTKRRNLGLAAWCDKSRVIAVSVRVKAENQFGNYSDAAAYARTNGGRVQCTTVSGGPREFTVY